MKGYIDKSWNIYLDLFPEERKDIYFTEEYVKLYQDSDNEAVCFIYMEDSNIFLFPFLLRRFAYNEGIYYDFETPYGYGGPITKEDDDRFLREALNKFYSFCKEANYVAGFTRFHPFIGNEKFYESIGSVLYDRKTIAMDLTLSEEEIWYNEIYVKNRNTIKKGEKNGLSFYVDDEYQYLDNFKELYHQTMCKLSADEFYYFNDDYFSEIKKIRDSFLGIVFLDNEILSAAIIFHSTILGHYHLSGSNMNYRALSPNNFLLYKTALELRKRNVKVFHLGGGTTSDEDDSLLKFKEKFSKKQLQFNIGKTIFNSTIYENLCDNWILNNPDKLEHYKHFLLKYKY